MRICSRQGRLRLAWDPPARWRMDAVTPVDTFTVVATALGVVSCRGPEEGDRVCRPMSRRAATLGSPFGMLLVRPERILRAIGADQVGLSDRDGPEGIGSPVECFDATGPDGHAEWCFTSDGVLVSFLEGAEVSDWTVIEATSATPGVAGTEFERPTG